MKKVLFFLILLPLTLLAAPVSEQTALQEARAFLAQRGMSLTGAPTAAPIRDRMAEDETSYYYLFNVGDNNGFVVVSGDDRTEAILGYSDEGYIGTSIPDGLQFLLDGYAEEIKTLSEDPVERQLRSKSKEQSRVARSEVMRASILPLIQTRWNQGAPYNDSCPMNEQANERCVTGCVATSMAQVMRYHHYPTAACSALPGYTSRSTLIPNLVLTLDALPATTFDWANMTNTYGSSSTDTAKAAVAELMQYCGWALQMSYNISSVGGSSSFNACVSEALKDYFGYDVGAQMLPRRLYSYTDWIEIIYAELAAGRPVVYGGQSAGGGHSFVCDGYAQDDYFHFNWGWGGTSDGYFRLSLLNPRDQGIGGSSSMDGFNYSQEIVIGIQPGTNPSGKAYGLSLEWVALNDNNLILNLINYKQWASNYDIALQMIPENGEAFSTPSVSQNFPFNHIKKDTFSMTCPPGAADGEYRIRVVCRPTGGSTWLDCQNCDGLPITATVTGGEMSIHVPAAVSYPKCSSLSVSGNQTMGYEQTVTAILTGGSSVYRNGLFLFVNNKFVMSKQTDVPAGETVEIQFAYTPWASGENKIKLCRAKSTNKTNVLDSTSVTIITSDATNTQDLTVVPVFTNLNSSGNLYGNTILVTATVTNPSTTNSYVGKMGCSVRKYNNAEDEINAYYEAEVHYNNIVVPANSSISVDFAYDDMPAGKYYALKIGHYQGYEEGGIIKTRYREAYTPSSKTLMDEGYMLMTTDGIKTPYPKTATIDCGDAAAVDLSSLTLADVSIITPSSNPNCLYLLKSSDAGQTKVSGNVVYGTNAPVITLDDNYPFLVPFEINATSISYTRTFTTPAAGTSGWSTICLPFEVDSVTCEDIATPVDWFHSNSDTGKNFWLREFTGDDAGTVYFAEADAMHANRPYIIAVPGNTWGDSWRMTGRAVTFHGSNAQLATTDVYAVSGYNYKFCGTTGVLGLENVYVLNAEGSSFVLQASATSVPFRGWFKCADINLLGLSALSISSGTPTELDVPKAETPVRYEGWYTIDGRHLQEAPTMRGFYIHNGQKCFIP